MELDPTGQLFCEDLNLTCAHLAYLLSSCKSDTERGRRRKRGAVRGRVRDSIIRHICRLLRDDQSPCHRDKRGGALKTEKLRELKLGRRISSASLEPEVHLPTICSYPECTVAGSGGGRGSLGFLITAAFKSQR